MPKGVFAYCVGMLTLFAGIALGMLILAWSFAVAQHRQPETPAILIVSGLFVFAAAHLLAAGLYRMLGHLYRAISRTEPAGDRPLRGRSLFLLGQLGCAMAAPTAGVFLAVAAFDANNVDGDKALWGALPAGFLFLASALVFFGGLGYMVSDIIVRQRDIVERREAERRRRLDEADELHSEAVPIVRPADDWRRHVKEDR